MDEIVVTKEGATKLFKGLNPSKALGPDELHSRDVKELATVLIRTVIDTGEIPNGHSLIFVHFSRKLTGHLLVITIQFLCISCKLLEHTSVCSNIMCHLDAHV